MSDNSGIIVCPSCGNIKLFVAVSPHEIQCQECHYVFPNHFAPLPDTVEGEGEEDDRG